MRSKTTIHQVRALAELRHRIRLFLQEGDDAARRVGLEPRQYQLLLAVRGLPEGQEATIRNLAERLTLRHHSTVELIDRMEAHGYVRRSRGRDDRRQVIVSLQPRGERLLDQVVRHRMVELRSNGRALVQALSALMNQRQGKSRPRTQSAASPSSHTGQRRRG